MLAPELRVCGAGYAFLSLDTTRFCALFQSSLQLHRLRLCARARQLRHNGGPFNR
jgi:hypothetical protein